MKSQHFQRFKHHQVSIIVRTCTIYYLKEATTFDLPAKYGERPNLHLFLFLSIPLLIILLPLLKYITVFYCKNYNQSPY